MIAPFVLIVLIAQGASQPPVPSARKSQGGQPQPGATSAKESPAADPRGTDNAPIVVRVQPTAKTDAETAKEQHKEEQQSSAHRWQVGAVIATILVGLLTLGAIGVQARIAARQNQIMEAQSGIMAEQREAAAKSASAASQAVALTEKQQAILEQQHAAITKQAEHMEGQLAAAKIAADAAKTSADALKIVHRQWLEVGFWGCRIEQLGNTGHLQARITVRVTNTSPLPLTVRTVRCYVNTRPGGYRWSNTALGPNGSNVEEMFHILTEAEKAAVKTNKLFRLILVGWVHYWNAFGDPEEQIIGVCFEITETGAQVRGVADLPRNLGRIARENPWPLLEPDLPK